jgi:hypothetical protein
VAELLAVNGFWFWLVVFMLTGGLINLTGVIFQRLFRTITVLFRGWPPSHLDADGDWKSKAGK